VLVVGHLATSLRFSEESTEFDLIASSRDFTKKPKIAVTFLSSTSSSFEAGHLIFAQLLVKNRANFRQIDAETDTGSPEVRSCSFLEP
jgi:hypothetical protein